MPDLESEGARFLLELNAPAEVHSSAGLRRSLVRGEIVLETLAEHPTRRGLRVVRFGLAATSVQAQRGPTGVVTIAGTVGGGVLTASKRASALRLNIDCTVNYESLDRAHGIATDVVCYYIPAFEPASASLEGRISSRDGELTLTDGRLRIACAAGTFNELHALVIVVEKTILRRLASSTTRYRTGTAATWDSLEDANTDANVCVQADRRRLTIQPVAFRADEADPNPTGGTAAAQFATAQAVWEKACITLQVNPTIVLTNPSLKTSSDLTAIRNAFSDPDPTVIEVFFVANSLPSVGGGQAGGIGLASCKPVIAEPNSGNPVLLTHELGHVLGLYHPGAGSKSDAGTVMVPVGSAMIPGSSLVTHVMCTSIANPALATLTESCCLTHDIGDHYIRDFPTDAGTEPSDPLPAGVNRYSMSNVWNRLSNSPGVVTATNGPEHQQPVRFNADMTPRTNFLFARVEQLVDLKVRKASVRFYRKDPGSGGGAQALHFVGEAPIFPDLAVGAPQYAVVPWSIPSGAPAHSCIFAVVRSEAEPEGDLTSLDWWQFEDLARLDNDWAQRNVDIQNVVIEKSGSYRVESGAWFVRLPPLKQRSSSKVTFDVDARSATGLDALDFEIVGQRRMGVTPGLRRRLSVDVRDQTGPLVVVLHAEVPVRAKVGRAFDVSVDPLLGRPVVGFMSRFRIGLDSDAVRQSVDVVAAAALDAAEFGRLESANDLYCVLKEQGSCLPVTVSGFAREVVRLRTLLTDLEAELARTSTAATAGARSALRELRDALDKFDAGRTSAANVMARFRAFGNRLAALPVLM